MSSRRQQEILRTMGITLWVRRELDRLGEKAEAPAAPQALDEVSAVKDASAPTQSSTSVAAESPSDANWSALQSEVSACTLCELHRDRTQTVFGVGDRAADVMVIGEAPGFHEDKQGEPFVGRAGGLLNRMLKAIGLARETVFIANVLKCRPPNNRDPKPEEAQSCQRYLERQIALVDPLVLLAVGRVSAQHLLGSDAPIGRLRGRVHQLPGRDLPLIVTYHPAYLLRSPEQKAKSLSDLLLLRKELRQRQSSA